jgi:hypothetical protein
MGQSDRSANNQTVSLISCYVAVYSRNNPSAELDDKYIFVIAFANDNSRHLSISSLTFNCLYFSEFLLDLGSMVNFGLTDPRTCPRPPSF